MSRPSSPLKNQRPPSLYGVQPVPGLLQSRGVEPGRGRGRPFQRAAGGVTRRWLWFGALALFLASGTGGCAQSRPCMIIPAQIELAKAKRDRAKEQYDRRLEEITRSLNNLEASRTRLERLLQERDELKALVPSGGGQ